VVPTASVEKEDAGVGSKRIYISTCVCTYEAYLGYGVATINSLLTIIGLFCRISSLL